MPQLGATELLIILAIVVVLFGASRIPEIMGGMGKGIREFRSATRDETDASASQTALDKKTTTTVTTTKQDVI
jgi:sec-independent protein translocase protein TatA